MSEEFSWLLVNQYQYVLHIGTEMLQHDKGLFRKHYWGGWSSWGGGKIWDLSNLSDPPPPSDLFFKPLCFCGCIWTISVFVINNNWWNLGSPPPPPSSEDWQNVGVPPTNGKICAPSKSFNTSAPVLFSEWSLILNFWYWEVTWVSSIKNTF